jgi:hypothetical protein
VIVSAVLVSSAVVLNAMQQYVHRTRVAQGSVEYRLELVDAPDWMPKRLRAILLAEMTPGDMPFSHEDLCRVVLENARRNPWLRSVRTVRKEQLSADEGVVRIHASYRRPIAWLQAAKRIYYVDREGVVVPTSQVPQWLAVIDGQVHWFLSRNDIPKGARYVRKHYIRIHGVSHPPAAVGSTWGGEDIRAGLTLVELMSREPFADQITTVDVRNFDKRVNPAEPELTLTAQEGRGRGTEIQFGQLPDPRGGNFIVPTSHKLQRLRDYYRDHNGRLAGIDRRVYLQYDDFRVDPYYE